MDGGAWGDQCELSLWAGLRTFQLTSDDPFSLLLEHPGPVRAVPGLYDGLYDGL